MPTCAPVNDFGVVAPPPVPTETGPGTLAGTVARPPDTEAGACSSKPAGPARAGHTLVEIIDNHRLTLGVVHSQRRRDRAGQGLGAPLVGFLRVRRPGHPQCPPEPSFRRVGRRPDGIVSQCDDHDRERYSDYGHLRQVGLPNERSRRARASGDSAAGRAESRSRCRGLRP